MSTRARRARSWTLVGALASLAACSVPSFEMADKAPSVSNSCRVDADCGGSGVCSGATLCVSPSSSEIESLVIEVVPPASAHFGAADSFLLTVDRLQGLTKDLTIPSYSSVTGKIVPDPQVLAGLTGCADALGTDGSLKVHVVATRSDGANGLPIYTAETNAVAEAGGWRYHLSLPPAYYDLYATVIGDCKFPPVLLPKQDFTSGATFAWPTTVPALVEYTGDVQFALPVSLKDWTVQLIEPAGGKPISTTGKLWESPSLPAISYVLFSDNQTVPLLKLSPPKDVVAPSVLWDLSALDLDNDHKIGLDISKLKWSTATVRARVESASSHKPIAGASVAFQSTSLADAPEGLTLTYSTTTQSDADGVVEANLVPGEYRLVVTPPDSLSSLRQEVWTVAASPTVQAGRTIQLEPAIAVSGKASEPLTGSGLGGIEVELSPWGESSTVLQTALGKAAVLPRRATGYSAGDGTFSVGADPGSFLLSARTDEATGFPWVVRTVLEVNGGPIVLGSLQSTYPLVLEGTVNDAWGVVQLAHVRAYLLLTAAGSSARKGETVHGALQIAETRSDSTGHYRLLLPSQLSR